MTWIVAALLTLIGYYKLEKMVHLPPLADAASDQVSVLLPLLVAVGAALLWRRGERIKEMKAA